MGIISRAAKGTARFFTPLGDSLGQGIAAISGVNKSLTESNQKLLESGDKALAASKTARDDAQRDKLIRIAQDNYQRAGRSFAEALPGTKKSNLQIAGEGAVTGLSALVVGKLAAGGKAAKLVAPLVGASKAISTLGKGKKATTLAKISGTGLRSLRSFGTGSLWGTAIALEQGKTKAKDIAKDAAIMGGFNIIAPVILGKALKISGKGIGSVSKAAKFGVESATKKLGDIASKRPETTNFLIDSANRKAATMSRTLAGFGERIGDTLLKDIEPALVDRLTPIKTFVNRYQRQFPGEKIVGTKKDAYIRARNYAGIDGKFTVGKKDYDNILKGVKGMEDEVLAYGKGLDLMTRMQKGQAAEGSKTLIELNQAMKDIEKRVSDKFGDDGLTKLQKGISDINDFRKNKILFGEYVDSGLVKREVAEQWVRENPNYTPHDVLDFVEDIGIKTFTGDGGKFNVLESGIKAAKGSNRELVNVYDADLHRLAQAQRIGERNRVTKQIMDMGKTDPQAFNFIPMTNGKVPKGVDLAKRNLEKVSFINDGIREDWLVPRDLGAAMKNLDAYQIPTWMKWLTLPQKTLRNFATRFNIAFTLTNFPRDIQTAAGINPNGFSPKHLVKALNTVADLDNPKTRSFFEGGGAFGGLISQEKPSRAIIAESNRSPVFNSVKNIGKLVERVGEHFENSVRFSVFLDEIERGTVKEVAIFRARNATVDFAKMGNAMAVLNQFIPFLNARTQGMVNIGTAINRDPTKFVRRQFTQAVYPAMLLYSHNRQFESYRNIPESDKENFWHIMVGERDGFDNTGAPIKVPSAIKIKKGEFGMATTNIVERYFSMSDQESPQSTGEFLFKQVMNLSPIDQGSLGTYTIPLELAANYDFFRGTPIEPEFQEIVPGGKKLPRENVPVELRANRFTGSTARFLSESYGKKINLSPARIEFIVNKIFAGTGRDVMSLVDMPQSGWDKTGIANNQALGVQKMSRMPIIRTFLQTSAAGEKIMLYDIVSKIRKEKIVPREIQLELEAQSNWEMIQGMDAQGQKNEANALFQDMNDDMRNRIRRIKENTSTGKNNVMQIYEKLQGNRLKILYLIEVLNKIQTKSETNRMFREFNRLDLLSDEVKRNLRNAKTKGLLISNKPD